ncbi:MAG: phosphoribosylformylglycinamidine synthase subunit PurS [Sandaracinaceae bacterium]|nr:phosphoribosylformylglycinamidine synthase subunit PurS [Sandaracinaceae bacterium]
MSLGFAAVKSASVGKLIEIEFDGKDRATAANPVIEDFRLELVERRGAAAHHRQSAPGFALWR